MVVDVDYVLDLYNGLVLIWYIYIFEYVKVSVILFNFLYCIFIFNVFVGVLDEVIFCFWWILIDLLNECDKC